MSFIGELISEVVGNHDRRDEAPEDPPYVQPPWVSRWDGEAGRWIFINEATGERSWERPVIEEAAEAFGREEAHMERRWDDGVQHVEDLPEDAARWTGEAVGAVESVPDRVEDGWDRTEDRVEAGWDRTEQGFENAGERVEDGFENAGDRVEDGWDNTVNAVEDAPENIAEWAGEGVGKVERFGDDVENYGDRLENSYDQGRDEERY